MQDGVRIEARRRQQLADRTSILSEVAERRADPEAHAGGHELRSVDDTGHTEVDRQRQAGVPLRGQPMLDLLGVEAHLRAGVPGDPGVGEQLLLVVERRSEYPRIDRRMAVGIGGNAHRVQARVGGQEVLQHTARVVVGAQWLGAIGRRHGPRMQTGVFALDIEVPKFLKIEELFIVIGPVGHATLVRHCESNDRFRPGRNRLGFGQRHRYR